MSTLITDCEVDGNRVDVRIGRGQVVEVQARLSPSRSDDEVIAARGGALLPGLHDQHLHLLALAADRASIDCSRGLDILARHREGAGWLRGVRATESVDRHMLDALVPNRPVRIQHDSGGLWMLNTRGLAEVAEALGNDGDVERDNLGNPTGRLWRYDARLRTALPDAAIDLGPIAEELRGYGLTAITDATPDLERWSVERLRSFPLRTEALGDPEAGGAWKLLLRDHDLPTYDELRGAIESRRPRPVAVHCVTRESLLLTLAVLDDVGRMIGDRIEHAAVVPDPTALRGLRVVTQPAFVTTRGESYRRWVDQDDLRHLYRFASLLEAGVDVVASSDAPYGPVDPWVVMRAAVTRELGPDERVRPAEALAGYLSGRRVRPGQPADVVLLHTDLEAALDALDAQVVRRTWIGGR